MISSVGLGVPGPRAALCEPSTPSHSMRDKSISDALVSTPSSMIGSFSGGGSISSTGSS